MPSVPPGAKVLVTGANGYLAMWIIQKLLDNGYSVRGTVRSATKGEHAKEYFKSYGDRFEIAIVDDFTKEGVFDECLVGVDAVFHPATPLPNPKLGDPQEEYIKPAVGGTIGVMKSALKLPQVKRIIYTSTLGTVARIVTEPTVLTEKDWNDGAIKMVEEQGVKAPPVIKYAASKVLAERAAFKIYEEEKATSSYDFLVLNAPWIFGPGINDINKETGSIATWYRNVYGNPDGPRTDELLSDATAYVDVRDLADLHVSALMNDNAVGERFIIAAKEVPSWQEWIDLVNKIQSETPIARELPKGKPGIAKKMLITFDTTKLTRVFGPKFRSIEETAIDMMKQFAEKGW